ncbi:MAG: ArsB/NhaD family transporter [Parasporobacterium sp.]|nr:ArsB/NhaD family transporter [Parasporobacterium sp.]
MSQEAIISILIFVAVMVVIITEKVHRAVVATGGAVLLLILGILNIEEGVGYIDANTIGLLVGMMLFVGVAKRSGMFEYLAVKSAKIAKGDPWKMMILFMIITAVFSALLDNVTTVLLVGPMMLAICKEMDLDPVPYIMSAIMASNIGGTGTLIGDPPNIMIGSATGFTFGDFLNNDGIIVVIIMVVTIVFYKFIYGNKMSASPEAIETVLHMDEKSMIKDPVLLKKVVVMIILIVAGFALHGVLHLESSMIALAGAVIMLIIGKQDVEEVVLDVEWPTIIFFTALFICVGGMEHTGVIEKMADFIMLFTDGKPVMTMMIILWVSAILSSTLDNIPFVATMIPLIQAMGAQGMDTYPLWWALSLGACLGGNGTLIGASANVVLTGISAKNGHPITYIEFLKIGFPTMILTLVVTTIYMLIRYA